MFAPEKSTSAAGRRPIQHETAEVSRPDRIDQTLPGKFLNRYFGHAVCCSCTTSAKEMKADFLGGLKTWKRKTLSLIRCIWSGDTPDIAEENDPGFKTTFKGGGTIVLKFVVQADASLIDFSDF
jgi:hypothetical protein